VFSTAIIFLFTAELLSQLTVFDTDYIFEYCAPLKFAIGLYCRYCSVLKFFIMTPGPIQIKLPAFPPINKVIFSTVHRYGTGRTSVTVHSSVGRQLVRMLQL
jgi:hypothetical protein